MVRCSECKRALSSTYYARGNTLYCKRDYTAKFQSTCHACEHNITGPVMVCVLDMEHTVLTKPVETFCDKVFILDINAKFIPLIKGALKLQELRSAVPTFRLQIDVVRFPFP